MNSPSSPARNYRRLGYLALAHAVVLLALIPFCLASRGIDEPGFWLTPLWVGLVTLWFFWPGVLTFHHGRSMRPFTVFASIAVVLMFPTLGLYNTAAPWMFGFPDGVSLNPLSNWSYFSAYWAGRTEAKKDVAAGVLAIERYGFGAAGGSYVRILRERHQIDVRPVAGCLVTEIILGHAAGYNAVSEREIDRRIGRAVIEAALEEGNRWDAEAQAHREKYFKDLAQRISSFSADSKIVLESLQVWADGSDEIPFQAEEEVRQFVRTVEKVVGEAVPLDATAFELNVSATLTPTEAPTFQTSASLSAPRLVYDQIHKEIGNLPVPQLSRGRLTIALRFGIRANS